MPFLFNMKLEELKKNGAIWWLCSKIPSELDIQIRKWDSRLYGTIWHMCAVYPHLPWPNDKETYSGGQLGHFWWHYWCNQTMRDPPTHHSRIQFTNLFDVKSIGHVYRCYWIECLCLQVWLNDCPCVQLLLTVLCTGVSEWLCVQVLVNDCPCVQLLLTDCAWV